MPKTQKPNFAVRPSVRQIQAPVTESRESTWARYGGVVPLNRVRTGGGRGASVPRPPGAAVPGWFGPGRRLGPPVALRHTRGWLSVWTPCAERGRRCRPNSRLGYCSAAYRWIAAESFQMKLPRVSRRRCPSGRQHGAAGSSERPCTQRERVLMALVRSIK